MNCVTKLLSYKYRRLSYNYWVLNVNLDSPLNCWCIILTSVDKILKNFFIFIFIRYISDFLFLVLLYSFLPLLFMICAVFIGVGYHHKLVDQFVLLAYSFLVFICWIFLISRYKTFWNFWWDANYYVKFVICLPTSQTQYLQLFLLADRNNLIKKRGCKCKISPGFSYLFW